MGEPLYTYTAQHPLRRQASLHAELDAAVLSAYGWDDLAPNASPAHGHQLSAAALLDALLTRLVALNAQLTAATSPLTLPALEAHFKGRGPWKNSLPRILETLQVLGKAQTDGQAWRS